MPEELCNFALVLAIWNYLQSNRNSDSFC